MASKYWIKLYHEIIDDPKMARLSDRLYRRLIELFLLAGEEDEKGRLPSLEDMAWKLRLTVDELIDDLMELQDCEFIYEKTGSVIWYVTNFAKRQSPVPGKERVARFRDRKRKEEYYGTRDKRAGNANETKRYTDTDTDTEAEAEEEINPDGIYTELSVAFCNKTKLPELTGGPQKWYESLTRMGKAGVQPIDIENAIDILRDKDYSIVRLSSVENTAIGEMSKRVGNNKSIDDELERRGYVQR